MLKRLNWPVLALLLGALGALLRRWQAVSAFEGEQGLHISGAPASWALLAFFALAAAVFLIAARSTPSRGQSVSGLSRWDLTFAADRNTLYMTLMVLAAMFALLAAPFLFQEAGRIMEIRRVNGGRGDNGLLQVALAVCTVPAAFGLLLSGQNAYRMRGRGREDPLLLIPVLLCCLWVLTAYRANASDPVIWRYAPLLLAAAMGTLFYLDCAGLSFGPGHARRMLWLGGMTMVSSAAALASLPSLSMSALLCSQMFSALAALAAAPFNMRRPPTPDRFGLRAQRRQGLSPDGPEPDETDGASLDGGADGSELQEDNFS